MLTYVSSAEISNSAQFPIFEISRMRLKMFLFFNNMFKYVHHMDDMHYSAIFSIRSWAWTINIKCEGKTSL